ncbi:ephexin isoform X2 [Xylocopa sonorina]|uniref:ephexin isoform X2 n=1 Tax=Xylocopa sonorina TaxID=1818115 RepID=UPI00403AC8E1
MNVSPVANRSFLHGDRKPSPTTDKIIYATLDSLALKGATLPLQLVPVGDKNVAAEGTNESKKKWATSNETAIARRSSFKVNTTCLSSRQHAKYLLVVSPPKPEPPCADEEPTVADRQRSIVCLQCTDAIDSDIDAIEPPRKPDTDYVESDARERAHPLDRSSNECSCSSNESPSDDYERIETAFVGDACAAESKAANEGGDEGYENDEDALCAKDAFVKSKSTNDLACSSSSETKLVDEARPLMETLSEEILVFAGEIPSCGKKKRHFTKNVLHFVPDYLVKGPKRRQKKKGSHTGSLSSLKALSSDSKLGVNSSNSSRYRSRSLSREEVKYLKISSPTNFVHVASATNPSLVSNENTVRFNLEQVVITHEQKCATLPLLVGGSHEDPMADNRARHPAISTTSFDAAMTAVKSRGEAARHKGDTFDIASLKRELLSELQTRTAKALESSQQVKTIDGRATGLSRAELPTNASFLWNNRTKGPLENGQSTQREYLEDNDTCDQYDDVGPRNIISEEDDYDDVGIPSSRVDGNRLDDPSTAFEDADDIYDDVMGPSYASKVFADNEKETDKQEAKEGEDGCLFDTNDYSSVDEDIHDMLDNDQDVYDDVGLPSEERVNSLYAGSTTCSILGSTWMNGKESEWEDLEDSATYANKSILSTETQAVPCRKKAGQKWSRKTKRQRSRVSRKSLKSSSMSISRESASCDNTSDDSTYESLHSYQPDDFSSDSESSKVDVTMDRIGESTGTEEKPPSQLVIAYLEAPTRPNPPPPREVSLTRTLGRRIKMLRRTWSITKGSLGRMRRRTSVDEEHSCEENKESSNEHSNLDTGKYFSFARHFKKNVSGPFSTFYLNGYTANGNSESTATRDSCNDRTNLDKQPVYSNPSQEMDHYSVLADQEPLYQFYVADAARVAFDSNSEGYEEVEGMIPSRCTTDLARPGYRTLWCQTPQVINNDLLQRLSKEEKKIQEAKFEILTSEASYLNSLRVLRNEFLNDSSIDEILTPIENDKLFGGIPSVLQASEQFLAELETVWSHDPMLHGLTDVLLKYADKCLDIYVAYCSNQVSIDTTLKDLRTRKGLKFAETVSQIEARSACQSLSLHSFLMLPMQRITRLPLLADAVLSKLPIEHDDRCQWERVLSSLNYVVGECNEGARAAVKEMEIENLARKLDYSVKIKPIALKGKHLVKSGPVVQLSTKADTEYKLTFGKRFNKTPLYLLLLTDYLLVAKYKSNTHDETYTVIDTCKRSLIALESVPEDSPFAGRNAMLLTLLENDSGHQVEYILTCESDTERQRWLEAVSPSKRGLIGETLYEIWDCPQVVALYCYSPNQPDELSLHPVAFRRCHKCV